MTMAPLSPRGVAVRLFLTCWLVYALHFATNTVREIYPALSLGDHLSFDVSEYLGFHSDLFAVPGRGAFINNNPGASMVGAVPYVLARPGIARVVTRVQQRRAAEGTAATSGYASPWPLAREFVRKARDRGLDVKFALGAWVMQAFAMAPLSALSVALMFTILRSLTRSTRAAGWLAVLYAFATPVLYRTAQLNQNLLVAHCALFAFALLWRPWDDPATPGRPHYFVAGLLSGWAVVCDYSGAVVVAVLAVYAALRRRDLPPGARARDDLGRFAVGTGIGIGVLLAYQWSCFGNPFLPAQHYMPPAKFTPRGYVGMDWPQLDLLWATAVDVRFGLFVSAPLLGLALYPPGWFAPTRLVGRHEAVCIAVFCGLFLLFCSANQYGRMQFNTGVRHVVPVVPFLYVIVAGVVQRLPAALAVLIGVGTTYWSWCLAMYRDVEIGSGVIDSIAVVSRSGPQFPWLTTLERLGYVRGGTLEIPVLLVTLLVIGAVWLLRPERAAGVSLP